MHFIIRRWEYYYRNLVSYSNTVGDKSCITMEMYNLAEPRWIKIDCNKTTRTAVVCMKEQIFENQSISTILKKEIFNKSCAIIKGNCYLFLWYKRLDSWQMKRLQFFNIQLFEVLFKAISEPFPPIYSPQQRKLITYQKYGHDIYYKQNNISKAIEGYIIFKERSLKFKMGGNLFKCLNYEYISIIHRCDEQFDCQGDLQTDELECKCNSTEIYSEKCKVIVDRNIKKCSFFYFQKLNSECIVHEQLLDEDSSHKNLNDKHIPCAKANSTFFAVSDVCTYLLNELLQLIPCKNGQHLESCEDFECNMNFKCPMSYCIPYSYVCNGKWDCPQGYDEMNNSTCKKDRQCPNMFK